MYVCNFDVLSAWWWPSSWEPLPPPLIAPCVISPIIIKIYYVVTKSLVITCELQMYKCYLGKAELHQWHVRLHNKLQSLPQLCVHFYSYLICNSASVNRLAWKCKLSFIQFALWDYTLMVCTCAVLVASFPGLPLSSSWSLAVCKTGRWEGLGRTVLYW